jgi:hypothetical protein
MAHEILKGRNLVLFININEKAFNTEMEKDIVRTTISI